MGDKESLEEHNCLDNINSEGLRPSCSECGIPISVSTLEDSDSVDVESVDTSDSEPEPIEKPYEVSVHCSHGMAGGLGQPRETVPADYETYGKIVHWVTKSDHMEYVDDGFWSDISVTVSDVNVTVESDHGTESTYISDCDRDMFEKLIESVV